MANRLTRLHIKNFRSLADVSIEVHPINVLFGPNGSGKSTLLDAIWFVRDCVVRDVAEASSKRSHGVGALWQGADAGANISIKLETKLAEYEVLLGFSSGKIEPLVGEFLYSKDGNVRLIDRKTGSRGADYYHHDPIAPSVSGSFNSPEDLALISYHGLATGYDDVKKSRLLAASELERLLRAVHLYHSHDADLYELKQRGSESNHHTKLDDRCRNLWSVLRNFHDKRAVDKLRYETILSYMRKCFPSFKDLVFDQTGPSSVYGSFVEKGRRDPIPASGVSDGQLQMLILLTALFSETQENESLILFDEPETSLHPYALSVFAEAVELATKEWNRQVFIATHSPVLIGQFEPTDILAAELDESGQTALTRVSEMREIQDLLENYDTGSLYIAEAIAAQSKFYSKERGE